MHGKQNVAAARMAFCFSRCCCWLRWGRILAGVLQRCDAEGLRRLGSKRVMRPESSGMIQAQILRESTRHFSSNRFWGQRPGVGVSGRIHSSRNMSNSLLDTPRASCCGQGQKGWGSFRTEFFHAANLSPQARLSSKSGSTGV